MTPLILARHLRMSTPNSAGSSRANRARARILGDVVAVIVCLTVRDPRLDSTAGEPDREAARMMIAPVIVGRELPLAVDRSSEFTAPHDQRILQQVAIFQILDQGSARLVGVVALTDDGFREGVVVIPASVKELDEANTALGEASRSNLGRKGPAFRESGP